MSGFASVGLLDGIDGSMYEDVWMISEGLEQVVGGIRTMLSGLIWVISLLDDMASREWLGQCFCVVS